MMSSQAGLVGQAWAGTDMCPGVPLHIAPAVINSGTRRSGHGREGSHAQHTGASTHKAHAQTESHGGRRLYPRTQKAGPVRMPREAYQVHEWMYLPWLAKGQGH